MNCKVLSKQWMWDELCSGELLADLIKNSGQAIAARKAMGSYRVRSIQFGIVQLLDALWMPGRDAAARNSSRMQTSGFGRSSAIADVG
jgi:hypothetical protein